MAKLTAAQLRDYSINVLRGMARDLAQRKFGSESDKAMRTATEDQLIAFIADNQDG
jgi:hypothetical protein